MEEHSHRGRGAFWTCLLAYVAASCAFAIPLVPRSPLAAAVAAFVLWLLIVCTAVAWVQKPIRGGSQWVMVGGAVVVWTLVRVILLRAPTIGWLTRVSGLGAEDLQALFAPLAAGAVLAVAVWLGATVGRILREPNLLPPVVLAAAIADYFTVQYGFTSRALTAAPHVVRSLAAPVTPAPVAAATPLPYQAIIVGPGDVVFPALFLSCLERFRLRVTASAVLLVILPYLGLLAVQLGIGGPLPGLPFVGLAVLLPNLGKFKYSAAERRALLVAVLLVIVGLVAITYLGRLAFSGGRGAPRGEAQIRLSHH